MNRTYLARNIHYGCLLGGTLVGMVLGSCEGFSRATAVNPSSQAYYASSQKAPFADILFSTALFGSLGVLSGRSIGNLLGRELRKTIDPHYMASIDDLLDEMHSSKTSRFRKAC